MKKCQKHKWNNKGKTRKSDGDASEKQLKRNGKAFKKTMEV